MASICTHTLGFPHLDANGAMTSALASFQRGDIDQADLEHCARHTRARHWAAQADAGLDYVTVGDFALHDHVAMHSALFGCAPAHCRRDGSTHPHFGNTSAPRLAPWFDTSSHYLVPEFSSATCFSLHAAQLLHEVDEAHALGHAVKVALIGPLTFLWLGQGRGTSFDCLSLLEHLLPAYCALLGALHQAGVKWVQLDEPILGQELAPAWRNAFEPCYWQLAQAGAQLMLATYFSPLRENMSLACRLPIAGLHVDGVRARHELVNVCDWLALPKVLSVGIVDGRQSGHTDLDDAAGALRPLLARRNGCLWLAPSCSLRHAPSSLAGNATARAQRTFAADKLGELGSLKRALLDDNADADPVFNRARDGATSQALARHSASPTPTFCASAGAA